MFFSMKVNVDISPEEFLRLKAATEADAVEYALLKKELARVVDERNYYHGLVLAAHLLEKMTERKDVGTIIPVLLSKIPEVFSQLENMEEVRLVQWTLQQLLPADAPAEILKMLNDAVPKQLPKKEMVKVEVKESGDIITGGGTKNMNTYTHRKGERTDDTDRNSER